MTHQAKLPTEVNRVRITAWLPSEIADRLDTAAIRRKLSSSGYIAGVLTRHCVVLDLFADGIDGHTIAIMVGIPYTHVMREIGRQVDAAKVNVA